MSKYFLKFKPEIKHVYQHNNVYFNTLVDAINYWISYKHYDKILEYFVKHFISVDISICKNKYKIIKTIATKYKNKKFIIITHPNLMLNWKRNLPSNCEIYDINSIYYDVCDFIVCDIVCLNNLITKFPNYNNIRVISFYNFIKKDCYNIYISPTQAHTEEFLKKTIKPIKIIKKIDTCFICLDVSQCYKTNCCRNEICNVCFEKCDKCPYCREINFSRSIIYKNKYKNLTLLTKCTFKLPNFLSLDKINFYVTNYDNIDIIKSVFVYYVNCKIYLIK